MSGDSSTATLGLEVDQVLGETAPDRAATAEPGARKRAVGQWQTTVQYDPDKGLRAADCEVPAADYQRRFAVVKGAEIKEAHRILIPGMLKEQAFVPTDVRGMFLEPIPASRRWKPVRIESKGELEQFHASPNGKRKLMVESESVGFGGDVFDASDRGGTDAMRLIDQEFIPLTGGPFNKQLYLHDYLYMHARAFELVNHNAIAAAAIKIMTRFVLGRGISYNIKHPKAAAIWEDFWERNNMRTKIRQMARDLPWAGELMLRYYEHRTGQVDVRVMDPSECWEVVTNPDDVDEVFYYHIQYPTPTQTYARGQIPSAKYIVAQIPPTNIQHLKLNCSSTERRGRSDLMPAMPWFKRLGDFYNGVTVKALLEANLVWKVKIHGELSDLQNFSTDPTITELPPPGGIWIENDQVDLSAVSTTLTAGRGASGIGGELIALIAASLNLPMEYFNQSGGGAARATALVRTDPCVKMIEDRQQHLREVLEEMYVRQMALALARGLISREDAREEPDTMDDPDQVPNRQQDEMDWLASQRANLIQSRLASVRS